MSRGDDKIENEVECGIEKIGNVLEKISSEVEAIYGKKIEIIIARDEISGNVVIEIITIEDKKLDPAEYNGYKKIFREINRTLEKELNSIYNAIEYQGIKIDVESEMKERIKPIIETIVFLIGRIEEYS